MAVRKRFWTLLVRREGSFLFVRREGSFLSEFAAPCVASHSLHHGQQRCCSERLFNERLQSRIAYTTVVVIEFHE
jgi:hypothetical protein